jgi:hypothetical protein
VETDAVIDGVKLMRVLLEEDVTAFAVRIVAEDVEEHDRLEALPVILAEAEVMILGIVFDELLERPRAKGTVLTQSGERDDVKAQVFTDKIRGDLSPCKAVLREIPERLLAAQGFIYRGILPALMLDGNKEGIVRAKGELTLDLVGATLDGGS